MCTRNVPIVPEDGWVEVVGTGITGYISMHAGRSEYAMCPTTPNVNLYGHQFRDSPIRFDTTQNGNRLYVRCKSTNDIIVITED